MIFTAPRWNGWLDHLDANTLCEGATSRIRRVPQGQMLDFFPTVTGWRHPWSVDVRWERDHWEAQIVEPGLVNAVDPLLEGVDVTDPDGTKRVASLLDFAWMPLRGFRSGLGSESKLTAKFFEHLGVRPDKGDGITVDEIGGVTITEIEDTNPLPPRQLMACDLYLAKARATFRASATVVDATGTSGVAVDYSVGYDTTVLDLKGTRPRVLHAAIFPPIVRPTLADRLMGVFQDDGEDRKNICSVYFLSPENFEGPLDGSWTPYTRHDLFWNLKHGAPNTPPAKPPAPIRFFSGLALGLGDAIVNQYLALDNALAAQIGNAVANTAPEGQFSIA